MAHVEEIGASRIVDGPDAVTAATRENLRQGASQIKLMTGGGAASLYDPLDVTEFFEEEIRAAVRAAEDWGTYVMVHVYNPRGDRPGPESRCAKYRARPPDRRTYDETAGRQRRLAQYADPSPVQQTKHLPNLQRNGSDIPPHQKHGVKIGLGTDLLFDPANTKNQNHGIVKLQKWFTNF